jgi:DNA-directed RNA polymerase subunit RPC12/RpoP
MCGKEYIETLKPGKGRMPRTKYCSDECRKKGRKESCLKNNENRTYVCLNCGKTFHRIKDHRFCDKTCYLEYISKHKFLAIEAVCINCGKTYIKTHKTQQYCSKSCYKQVQCADDLFSTAKCKTCGKPFVKEGPDQTCCSADCYLISLSQ